MTKAGQADIRRLLIIGAMSRLGWLGRRAITEGSWLSRMLARKRWSWIFDQYAALLRWIRISFQAANLIGSVLLSYASSGVKIPCVECGRSPL